MDIHNYKRRFERTIERIEEAEDISKENKETIFNFKDYLLSENVGTAKIERYLYDLMKYSKMLNKSFEKASKEDIRRVVGEINQLDLAEETKRGFKIVLRKLYRFIEGIEEKGMYPEKVYWISINIQENHKKLPEELLTEKEIKSIIEKCDNLRDRALISVLAESGCRISEVGTLQIKHVSFEEYGARGYSKFAPYDKIVVSAASFDINQVLLSQLIREGIMVLPVGHIYEQKLLKITNERELKIESLGDFLFVPLRKKH